MSFGSFQVAEQKQPHAAVADRPFLPVPKLPLAGE